MWQLGHELLTVETSIGSVEMSPDQDQDRWAVWHWSGGIWILWGGNDTQNANILTNYDIQYRQTMIKICQPNHRQTSEQLNFWDSIRYGYYDQSQGLGHSFKKWLISCMELEIIQRKLHSQESQSVFKTFYDWAFLAQLGLNDPIGPFNPRLCGQLGASPNHNSTSE